MIWAVNCSMFLIMSNQERFRWSEMNKPEEVVISGGVSRDALVMSASDYADWEQSRSGITKPQLNRAQRRALAKERRHAK